MRGFARRDPPTSARLFWALAAPDFAFCEIVLYPSYVRSLRAMGSVRCRARSRSLSDYSDDGPFSNEFHPPLCGERCRVRYASFLAIPLRYPAHVLE